MQLLPIITTPSQLGTLATSGSLTLAAKVKWALYKHRSMLLICLCSYITAVVQLCHSYGAAVSLQTI